MRAITSRIDDSGLNSYARLEAVERARPNGVSPHGAPLAAGPSATYTACAKPPPPPKTLPGSRETGQEIARAGQYRFVGSRGRQERGLIPFDGLKIGACSSLCADGENVEINCPPDCLSAVHACDFIWCGPEGKSQSLGVAIVRPRTETDLFLLR